MTTMTALVLVLILNLWAHKLPLKKIKFLYNGDWIFKYLDLLLPYLKSLPILRGSLTVLCVLLPILILVSISAFIMQMFFGPIGKILLIVIILHYCINSFAIDEHISPFVQAHERAFGFLFWFMILGPVGTTIYWILVASKKFESSVLEDLPEFSATVNTAHGFAAWIPARITGFIYALIGDFILGYKCWFKNVQNLSLNSSQLLLECGQASLGAIQDREAKRLVNRAFIVWVAIGIILAFVGWSY